MFLWGSLAEGPVTLAAAREHRSRNSLLMNPSLLARVGGVALLGALLVGCSSTPTPAPVFAEVQPFSANRAGASLPHGWRPWIINRNKAPTRYDLVLDPLARQVVLHAVADRSASGLKQRLDVDSQQRPWVSWRWRVTQLIEAADNTDRDAEDSPVRLMLFFDGDRATLPGADLVKFELARLVSGQEPPFATLMYIWENRQPPGTVIGSSHSGRIRMIVAGSGVDRLGQWKQFERNYVDDYRRAYGEAPGRLIGIGILTDTDNTGGRIEAFYGDIRLSPAPAMAALPVAQPVP